MLMHIYIILFCLYDIYAFQVPRITIQPLSPKGLEVSIPHIQGIELFSFGGQLNAELKTSETLTISRTLGIHKNNKWTFSDKSIKWNYDDVISYWFYLEYSDGGKIRVYNTTGEQVIVRDFVRDRDITCIRSLTVVNGMTIDCTNTLVFEELFHHLDYTRWEVEKYNPFAGPNFEFNSYERDRVGLKNNALIIQPIPKLGVEEVRGKLDLRNGCTSVFPEAECLLQRFLLPPVKSGKIVSKATFKYGKIQIRAKLPAGDWIFPEVALVPKDKKNRITKIWIAYARGNENLQDANGEDIGARLFFCGPAKSMNESERRDNLANRRETFPFTSDYHVYTLFWLPTEIICFVDNVKVGKVSTKIGFSELNTEFHVSLGVGVAGNNDFPDDSKSGGTTKPWINRDSKQVISFFDARYNWTSTWKGDDSALKVDSVKVYSISKESDVNPNFEESEEQIVASNHETDVQCIKSETIVNGRAIYFKGALVFEDSFHNLDTLKWNVESYIPLIGPNYEFNSYEKSVVKVENSTLEIKPIPKHDNEDLRGTLDLTEGCTGIPEKECYLQQHGFFVLPPVTSGKVVTNSSFKFGKVEIRAKLPAGDWIFPEISLIPKERSERSVKILIAYARGNKGLVGPTGHEIGGNVLYSGPVLSASEPSRSQFLKSKKISVPYSNDMHTFTYIWKPGQMIGMVDNEIYAEIDTSEGFPELDTECHLALGVAVGGINDFPDGSTTSGSIEKPWNNKNVKQVKQFFGTRSIWLSTWGPNEAVLKVDSVKIYSV